MNSVPFLTLAALCSVALAQGEDATAAAPTQVPGPLTSETQAPQLPAPARGISAKDLLVPIHTQQADPEGGEYGWWAAGASFKVSFHEGYTFYPYLGPTYAENLPVAWRNTRVTVGNASLIPNGAVAQHAHGAWRYEYRYPGVTEAYDVTTEGVEQTFTIHARPAVAGELVIRGEVQSKLRCPATPSGHQALTFVDVENVKHVTYGEAIAVDANGRRTKVQTSFDGTSISLTVDAATVASAAYPLYIDPLTAAVMISTWGGTTFGLASFPAIGRDDESTTSNIMTFYARQFSASDFDGYARLTNNDFSNSGVVYTDVTTTWSSGRAGVASVGGTNRWALCLERDFGATGSNVRVYLHDFANVTLNSGTTLFLSRPAGESYSTPEIGGTRSFSTGNNCLLVWRGDITATGGNTANSEAWGMLVDTSGVGTLGTRFRLDNTGAVGTTFDRENPCVNQESNGGTASWIVGWQQLDRTIINDDYDFIIARISSAGVAAGRSFLGPSGGLPHKTNPRIAGRDGRYMGSYLISDTISSFGKGFEVHRFDWLDTAASPVKKNIRTIASGGTADYVNGAIAFDTITDSHWALVYQRGAYTASDLFVVRVGYTGGYSPSITFDDDSQSFLICYATTESPPSGLPVFGVTFNYPTTAVNVLYGTGCKGTISANDPFAGHEFFTVYLGGAQANRPAALFFGVAPAAQSLAPIGMNPCFFNMPVAVASFGATTSASGSASITFPIPDEPSTNGNAYWQWAFLDSTVAWSLKAATTQGLRSQIR